jgi:hypothetical protein
VGFSSDDSQPELVIDGIEIRPPGRQEAVSRGYRLAATTGRTGSRKIASPPTGLRGTADVSRHPFAGSKSRKQPLDACLTDPANYLGLAPQMVDRAIALSKAIA